MHSAQSPKYDSVIFDGNNILFRSFFTKKGTKMVHGTNTSPLYIFLRLIKSVVQQYECREVFITWDKRLNPEYINFRRILCPQYKTQRSSNDTTNEIHSYMDKIYELCTALGCKTIFPYNLEGDDVIFWLANQQTKENKKTLIVSSDKDLLQLIRKNVHQLVSTGKNKTLITDENFSELVGLDISDFVLYKCILGDVSDNVPGIYGYGEVRAKNLIANFRKSGKFENLTDEQKSIIELNRKILDLSYMEMSELSGDIVAHKTQDFDNFAVQYEHQRNLCFDATKVRELFQRWEFHDFIRSFGDWTQSFSHKKIHIDENTSILDFMKM